MAWRSAASAGRTKRTVSASEADKVMAERWQKASGTARERALAQIGEVEEAYFDVRLV